MKIRKLSLGLIPLTLSSCITAQPGYGGPDQLNWMNTLSSMSKMAAQMEAQKEGFDYPYGTQPHVRKTWKDKKSKTQSSGDTHMIEQFNSGPGFSSYNGQWNRNSQTHTKSSSKKIWVDY